MSTIAAPRIGSAGIAGGFARAQPTVTLTAPSGTINSSPITVTWTYFSPISRTQAYYRIRLLSQDGSSVVYDSAILSGSLVTTDLDLVLSGGSTYQFAVSASDGYDWSTEATSTVFFDGSSLADVTPLAAVGQVYEVGINGVGYMLADHPDRDIRYARRIVPLDPPRLATGDTPFSEAVERYTMLGWSDWSDGAGQRFARRDTSSAKAYYTSSGINPFEPGELRLLPSTSQFRSSAQDPQRAVIAGGKIYIQSSGTQLAAYDDPTDVTATTFSHGAGTAVDLASDGTYWYVADGSNVWRGATASTPGAAWSTEDAQLIEWCTDRIVIAKKTGSSTTPNAIATLSGAGAVSGPGAGSTPFTFEEETDIRSITSGDGYVWWAAARYDRSVVYSWKLGSTDSYLTAFQVPAGQEVRSVGYYQGNVFIAVTEPASTGNRLIIYRGVPQQGALTVTRVLDIADGVDRSVVDFAGDDRFVFFSWKTVGSFSGIGAIDLSTGGWAKWLEATAGTGNVRSILSWYGRAVFTVDGSGTYIEQIASGGNDNTVSSGVCTFSVDDLNTSQRKRFTNLRINFDPLPAGATITVAYSLDGGTSFTTLTPIVDGDGQKTADWDMDEQSDSMQLRVTLTHGSTTTPVLRNVTVRANAIGLADQVLILPITCYDQVTDLRGRPLPENGAGVGAARARTLEGLVQTSVLVQDVDWQQTQTAQVFDVVACDITSVGVRDPKLGRQAQGQVAVLTLRRSVR